MRHIKQTIAKKHKSNLFFHAFTLVELIVVIVILSILATIAFLSFNSYSSSSRDSVRLSDINSLNKSLELFNISAAKYPDPTNVYTRVVYSGGVIFEQGNMGDSVITAVQKVSKKPIDPLDSGEYTYSTNLNRTSFQLKGTLENKLSTGYNDIIENSIPHLTPAYRQAGPSNIGEELISSIFPLTRENTRGLFDGMTAETNADTNSGSRICYVKGNFNGLIEKTNTGNTNYILAVPGLIVGETNYNLDYNSLSGKVICNGLSNPCIINYTPTLVFVGTGNSVPTTSTQITDIMTSLQSAYSGSNVSSSNTTISNLLSSSGSNLVSLGSSLVSKVGVTSSNIVVTNASCTLSGVTVNHGSSVPAYSEYFIIGTAGYDCPNRTITRTCNNGVLDGSGVYMYNTCVKGAINNCSPGNYSSAGTQTYNLSTTLNHPLFQTGTTNIGITNGTKVYTARLSCNDGVVTVSNEGFVTGCDTNYSLSGATCEPKYPGCDTYDIQLGNGQVWAACNVGATTTVGWNSIGTQASNPSTILPVNRNQNVQGNYYQWGRKTNITTTTIQAGRVAVETNSNFYENNTIDPYDWLLTRDDNRWGGSGTTLTSGIYSELNISNQTLMQGPCENGYHIPTVKEWCSAITTIDSGLTCTAAWVVNTSVQNTLKLPFSGSRCATGYYCNQGINGYYQTSSPNGNRNFIVDINSTQGIYPYGYPTAARVGGYSVRCLKN